MNMQKDLLRQDVNQQLPGQEFDNCSFYRLKDPNTYLCLHKGDCWENSFVVFQKGNETRVMRGATFKWLNNTTNNREEIAYWFTAEDLGLIKAIEVTFLEVSDEFREVVSKCLEEISSK